MRKILPRLWPFDLDDWLVQAGIRFGGGLLLAYGVFALLSLAVSVVALPIRTADTTDKSWWSRSGVRVHTDCATGVQYLATPNGGLTPRLNADGSLHREPC